ncbi:Uu.00g132890.m01.CDS01 [Anthostomella pinea]|uniref:Uu.00g132890.m01.CDS01 n=1 Tax=Anthostomella pinea TaxID=933095 RepID=A0AAI8VTJ5_9PEZI|nr:Uu.00g132890.m01.CDS01 [Anthostomella pinea]
MAHPKSFEFDLYAILRVESSASAADIKTAYRALSLKYHPDKKGDTPENNKSSNSNKRKAESGDTWGQDQNETQDEKQEEPAPKRPSWCEGIIALVEDEIRFINRVLGIIRLDLKTLKKYISDYGHVYQPNNAFWKSLLAEVHTAFKAVRDSRNEVRNRLIDMKRGIGIEGMLHLSGDVSALRADVFRMYCASCDARQIFRALTNFDGAGLEKMLGFIKMQLEIWAKSKNTKQSV